MGRSDASHFVGGLVSNSGDPTPAVSIIPVATEDDPIYRQLCDENARLRQRNEILTRRLADAEAWMDRIMVLVMERQGVTGVAG